MQKDCYGVVSEESLVRAREAARQQGAQQCLCCMWLLLHSSHLSACCEALHARPCQLRGSLLVAGSICHSSCSSLLVGQCTIHCV